MKNQTLSLSGCSLLGLAGASLLMGGAASTSFADFPQWEDRMVGETYGGGDTTLSSGVPVTFGPIMYPTGGSGSGNAKVGPEDTPCNSGNLIEHYAISSKYDFAGSIGTASNAVFLTKHNGGIINLAINGSPVAYGTKWSDYHASWIGGVFVRVLSGGGIGDCTRVLLEGAVDECIIGLAEGWVDAPAPCERPTYDDLPYGTSFPFSTNFVTDGIDCVVEPYINYFGTPVYGDALVDSPNWSCGDGFELKTRSCNVSHDFGAYGGVNDVTFRCGEYGGGVNIAVNGDFASADDWIVFDGMTLGGCLVSVVLGGDEGDCTIVELAGHVDKLTLGGEENAIDCIEWLSTGDGNPNGNPCTSYDDMAPMPTQYHVFDSFFTDGILCEVRPQQLLDGSEYTAGSAFAQPSMLACGSGQELVTNACAVDHRFADSIGSIDNLSVTVADHGGDLNLEINGDMRVFPEYSAIDGLDIGGVIVTVVSGGGINECTDLRFDGRVDNIVFGGGQHFIDCLEGDVITTPNPDLNDDGLVNGLDLSFVLGDWGGPNADINGDGTTDGGDLALVLGAWTF